MRSYFFGKDASTLWRRKQIEESCSNYVHYEADIRYPEQLERIFQEYEQDIQLIIHAAAQPSHDWAAREPMVDFEVNANGTLHMLELTRQYCPSAVFIYTSTNKVYGDTPNRLPLVELASRWEIDPSHPFYENGIDESMSIDQSKHSLFGASKLAADVLAQEYGRYFNMKVGVFRGGCLTGPGHSGAMMHGFLSYLMKCAVSGDPYTIHGYQGKQVRDHIHSADLVQMFYHFYKAPGKAGVYNVGGGRQSNCSVIEAIVKCEALTGKKMKVSYSPINRVGDHIWYISDVSRFKKQYPEWDYQYSLDDIMEQMMEQLVNKG